MNSKHKPSLKELKEAHEAESKAISDRISDGYDFQEEMESSVFNSLFEYSKEKSSLEMNRKRLAE